MQNSLPRRPLGKTGLHVSVLGFGAAPIADLYENVPETQATETVLAALNAGVNLVDTSPLYGRGLSELRVGAALRHFAPDDLVLSTKVGRVLDPFSDEGGPSVFHGGLTHGIRLDYGYDGTMRSLEQSLLRLGREKIDIALVHDLDRWTHRDQLEAHYGTALDGAVKALTELREGGVIAGYGLGVNESDVAERFARDCDPDVILLAGRYSLLQQPALATFLPLMEQRNIGVILGGVFNSGILATGAVPGARYDYAPAPPEISSKVEQIEVVCSRHETPIRRAALHFALGHPAVSSLVLGAVSPEEVAQQVDDMSQPPPAEMWQELVSEELLDPAAPTP